MIKSYLVTKSMELFFFNQHLKIRQKMVYAWGQFVAHMHLVLACSYVFKDYSKVELDPL